MRRNVKIITCICLIALTCVFCLYGCDISRKLTGAEVKFPEKIAGAEYLSFDMQINYKSGEDETNISMSCYKAKDEYSYEYYLTQKTELTYHNLYADNKLYEIVDNKYNVGSYYVVENVPYDDQGNFLYVVTTNIMAVSIATLATPSHKETANGKTLYRYDVTLDGNKIKLWFDSDALVKVYAEFESKDQNETTTKEEYTITLSNYKFGEKNDEPFTRPENLEGVYIPSPITFESWVSIIDNFAAKFGA